MRFSSLLLAAIAVCAHASAAPVEGDNTVPAHFACTQDSDCEERNVGNCCGYYPMCANSQAELPDPCPDRGFGVCGFPSIDECKCGKGGGCVSLQGGEVVHGAQWDEPPAAY